MATPPTLRFARAHIPLRGVYSLGRGELIGHQGVRAVVVPVLEEIRITRHAEVDGAGTDYGQLGATALLDYCQRHRPEIRAAAVGARGRKRPFPGVAAAFA